MTEDDHQPDAVCTENGNCLKMVKGKDAGGLIQIHDSNTDGPGVPFPREAIAEFLDGVKGGEFDDFA